MLRKKFIVWQIFQRWIFGDGGGGFNCLRLRGGGPPYWKPWLNHFLAQLSFPVNSFEIPICLDQSTAEVWYAPISSEFVVFLRPNQLGLGRDHSLVWLGFYSYIHYQYLEFLEREKNIFLLGLWKDRPRFWKSLVWNWPIYKITHNSANFEDIVV